VSYTLNVCANVCGIHVVYMSYTFNVSASVCVCGNVCACVCVCVNVCVHIYRAVEGWFGVFVYVCDGARVVAVEPSTRNNLADGAMLYIRYV